MDKELKLYLSKIENYLKHIDIIERTDIIEELKSNILDMKSNENLTNEQIINRLGEPKEIAKAYFSENIQNGKKVKIIEIFNIINFYSAISLITLMVVPMLASMSIGFIIGGIGSFIGGILVIFNEITGVIDNLGVGTIGIVGVDNIFLELIICIVVGISFYIVGRYCWILLIKYIKTFIIKKDL